nr:uncharacterized protein LOC108006293 [Drosophila suzukii]XP_016925243.2 uncharacterized protein LOC108006293 [Drosophila suzukii]
MAELKPFLCNSIDKSLWRSEWEVWLRAFNIYADSEEISSTLKKSNKLLHLGGSQLQSIVYNLPGAMVPYITEEQNAVFTPLVEKLNEYFSPIRNSVFERHLYRGMTPRDGECFTEFLMRLRQQVRKCNFGTSKTEIEEIYLKDKLVDSWAPAELKKKLLSTEQSLEGVISACLIEEQVSKQTQSMSSMSSTGCSGSMVNKIASRTAKWNNTKVECGRCGRYDHDSNSLLCPAKNAECNRCSKVGHFAKRCRTTVKRSSGNHRGGTKRRYVDEAPVRAVSGGQQFHNPCFRVANDCDMGEVISCRVGGLPISMVIDSGSKYNLLSQDDSNYLQEKCAAILNLRTESTNQFRAYAADQLLQISCVFEAPIAVGGNAESIATFYVIKKGRQSLLGRETAIKLNVLRLGIAINRVEKLEPFPK